MKKVLSIFVFLFFMNNADSHQYLNKIYNNSQASALDPLKDRLNQIWLLKLDSLGCLPGYPCDTIIRIRPTVKGVKPNFNIGTKWVYETIDASVGGGHYEVNFVTWKILDTNNTNGKKIFYLSSGDSMYVENEKMYFWDEHLNSYEMYYDFNTTSDYEIKYWQSSNNVQIAKVKVDSVYNTILNNDTIPTQLLKISNNGSWDDDHEFIVYKNIGAAMHDPKLYLGKGLWDPSKIITKLRCFKSDSIELNFQTYPCDSSWWHINIANVDVYDKFKISPNPTSDLIHISGIDHEITYVLYNFQGKEVVIGETKNSIIEIPYSGVFMLKIFIENAYFVHKIIKI